jgi:PQQ-like domain
MSKDVEPNAALSRRAGLAAFGVLALFALRAPAETRALDPSLPHQRVVGAPRGPAPMPRLDGARTGRSRFTLPRVPRVVWRTRAPGGIEYPVAVADDGSVVASGSIPTLSEIARDGKLAWSVQTEQASPVTSPFILSDDTRVVVTSVPAVMGVGPAGHVRFRRALPAVNVTHFAPPLALDDGDFVLGLDAQVLKLMPNGDTEARADLPETVDSILAAGDRLLIVEESGAVFAWRPPAAPTQLASFGAKPNGGAAVCGSHALCAVVDPSRLVELDLKSGLRKTRAEVSGGLQGPPAVLASGETRVVTMDGLLLGQRASGSETLQIALEPPSLAPAGSAPIGGAAPPVVVDARGDLGFVRAGLDAGVVDAHGAIHRAPGAACGDPVDVAPAGPDRLVVACRSGLLWMLGNAVSDKAR